MGRMLRRLWDRTGHVFMASCSAEAALFTPCGGGLTFAELVATLPGDLSWLVPVVCGNDLYKRGKIPSFDEALLAAVDDLCRRMQEKAACVCAVFGGSSSLWQYAHNLSPDAARRYDAHVERLRARFEERGVPSVTGAVELSGVILGDKIGHVSIESEELVFTAFETWVAWCVGNCATSDGSGGCPAAAVEPVVDQGKAVPPAPPVLPAGWSAVWARDHRQYWFLHQNSGRTWDLADVELVDVASARGCIVDLSNDPLGRGGFGVVRRAELAHSGGA